MTKYTRLPSHCAETEAAIQRFEAKGGVVKVYAPWERSSTERTMELAVRGDAPHVLLAA